MAAITSAVVVAAGSAYAANRQGAAAKKAAGAQSDAANAANAESARQFDLSRQDQMPWLDAGQNALNLQQQYLAGDTSGFDKAPDYAFAVNQGFAGLDRGAARGGNLWGGGTDADRMALGQGLATQYANNYWNKLAGLSGTGQGAAQNLGSLGANFANSYGNNLQNAGAARASAYQAQGQAQSGYANALGSGLGAYFGANQWGAQQPVQQQGWGNFAPNQQGFNSGSSSGSVDWNKWGQGWGG
jgi:hypothetical protein